MELLICAFASAFYYIPNIFNIEHSIVNLKNYKKLNSNSNALVE